MKKLVLLILTAFMLASCSSIKYENGKNEEFLKTLDLTPPVFSEDNGEKVLRASIEGMGWMLDEMLEYKDDYRYSIIPEGSFYVKQNPDYPDFLYSAPANTYAEENSKRVLTNAETIKYLSPEKAEAILQTAKDIMSISANYDYRDMDSYIKNSLYYKSVKQTREETYVDETAAAISESKQIMQGGLAADLSAIYIDSDGFYRVRGVVLMKATAETGFGATEETKDKWFSQLCEITIGEETPAGEPWEQGEYVLKWFSGLTKEKAITDAEFEVFKEKTGLIIGLEK